ncbi:histidine phosphatase family protein [Nocardia salmonicida]
MDRRADQVGRRDPVTEVEGVYEVPAGDFEGLKSDAAQQAVHRAVNSDITGSDVAIPGGEAGNDVLARFVPALDDLRVRYPPPRCALVRPWPWSAMHSRALRSTRAGENLGVVGLPRAGNPA